MFAIVMAGGSGTRFWPASRERLPKQFLKITSQRTMIEDTILRVEPVVGSENIYVVVGKAHQAIARQLLTMTQVRILVEPFGRNTAACIGLAALHVRRVAETEPMIVLPSDHFIADVEAFKQALEAACEVARSGAIVTIGVLPTRPETGYGYIEVGKQAGCAHGRNYYRVERFVEKPDQETAINYIQSGKFLWNSGIFAFTARTILSEIERCMPGLHSGLTEIDRAIGTADYDVAARRVYSGLEAISIDYGVLEKTATPIYTLRADFGWSDVGSWQALYELRVDRWDEEENLALGDLVALDSKGNLVYSDTGRVISLLGVEGLVVVDTCDALLVARMSRSQDVKRLPELLKRRGRAET
jgi:mannose-1-phosphate guanylyltransferase